MKPNYASKHSSRCAKCDKHIIARGGDVRSATSRGVANRIAALRLRAPSGSRLAGMGTLAIFALAGRTP